MTLAPLRLAVGAVMILMAAGCSRHEVATKRAVPTPTPALPTWVYSTTTDEMDGSVHHSACVNSENEFRSNAGGNFTPILCMVYGDGTTGDRVVFIADPGDSISCDDDCLIRIRVDQKPGTKAVGLFPSNGRTNFVKLVAAEMLPPIMQTESALNVEIYLDGQGPQIAHFNIKGLKYPFPGSGPVH